MSEREEKGKKARIRTKLQYPLPDSQTSFEKHLDIIKAYVVASKEGKEPVSYRDFKTLVDLQPTRVSGNNKFLENIGLIRKVEGERGKYLPEDVTIRLYNALKWNKEEEIRSILRELLLSLWFWDFTKQLLDHKGTRTRTELRDKLGYESGADPKKHNSALNVLIDYLIYAGLIKEEDGNLAHSEPEATPPKEKKVKEKEEKLVVTSAQPLLVLGVLISPEMSEEQIRKAVRIIMDEWKKLHGEKND